MEASGEGHLERLRRAEIETVREHFRSGQRVLELGGGSGYQAGILASWGCRVQSIDLAARLRSRQSYYRVLDYDGQRIQFRGSCFDVVFSSNVLEHIKDLPSVLAEVRRVLKEDGRAIHIVPATAFRSWTIVAHYGYLVKYLLGRREMACAEAVPAVKDVAKSRGLWYLVGRAWFPGPHGEYPSAAAELWGYSRRRWVKVFQEAGFEVLGTDTTGVFYTGYALCPGLSLERRRAMARWLGSACHVFAMRAAPAAPSASEAGAGIVAGAR